MTDFDALLADYRAAAARWPADALPLVDRIFAALADLVCRGALATEHLVALHELATDLAFHRETARADAAFDALLLMCRGTGRAAAALVVALDAAHLALGTGRTARADGLLSGPEPRALLSDLYAATAGEPGPHPLVEWEGATAAACPDLGGHLGAVFARAYLVGGAQAVECGLYPWAEQFYLRGLTHRAAGGEALFLLRLATARLEMGDVDGTGTILALAETACPPEALAAHVGWLECDARLALLCGDLGRAQGRLDAVSDRCSLRGLIGAAAVARLNQAAAATALGQIGIAADLLAAARPTLPPDARSRWATLVAGLSDRRRAFVALAPRTASGVELWNAPAPVPTAAPAPTRGGEPLTGSYLARFDADAARVRAHLAAGQLAEADALLTAIEDRHVYGASPLADARLAVLGAERRHASGDAAAGDTFRAACAEFDRLKLLPDALHACRLAAACAARRGDADAPALAVAAWERTRRLADSLPPPDQLRFLLTRRADEERAAAAELDALDSSPSPERLSALLDRTDAARRALTRDSLAAPADGPLEPGEWVLSFLAMERETLVVLGGGGTARWWRPTVARADLRRWVGEFYAVLSQNMRASQHVAPLTQLAGRVAGALGVGPALASVPDGAELVVVPDDALHGFPWAACPVGANQVLGETHPFTIRYDRAPPAPHPRTGTAGLAASAARAIPDRELWYADDDAAEAAGLLERLGAACRPRRDATPAEVLAAWPAARLAHFAAHGEFEPTAPLHSGLVLNGGRLTAAALAEACGAGAPEHVTLGSCWGADGFAVPGGPAVSLPEVLLRRGVGSVLACLWPVNDLSGMAFAKEFYTALVDGSSRARAAHRARAAVRRPMSQRNPIHWAGFQLYGAAGPLPPTPATGR